MLQLTNGHPSRLRVLPRGLSLTIHCECWVVCMLLLATLSSDKIMLSLELSQTGFACLF